MPDYNPLASPSPLQGLTARAYDLLKGPHDMSSIYPVPLTTEAKDNPSLKHNEDVVLNFIDTYIRKTYSEHYNTAGGIQAIDVWQALEIDEASFHSNIIKYAMRYKQKDGANYKDLVKIVHYTILLLARNHLEEING